MGTLTPSEIDRYRDVGYVVPAHRLDESALARLREALEETIEANPSIRPEHLLSVHIAGRNREGVVGHEAFLELATDPRIVDMVAALIGPDVVLWGCQAFCKPGGDGMEVPWHQDGHYWPIRPLATCTVWVALDDSTVENGCLRVLSGSHRAQRLFEHERDDREGLVLNRKVLDDEVDVTEAVDVELEAGQMSLHDIYMVHGSNPNRSPRRRAGVAIRYMPATSHFDRALYPPSAGAGYLVDFSTRPLWLLRGSDRSGRNDFDLGHRPAHA